MSSRKLLIARIAFGSRVLGCVKLFCNEDSNMPDPITRISNHNPIAPDAIQNQRGIIFSFNATKASSPIAANTATLNWSNIKIMVGTRNLLK